MADEVLFDCAGCLHGRLRRQTGLPLSESKKVHDMRPRDLAVVVVASVIAAATYSSTTVNAQGPPTRPFEDRDDIRRWVDQRDASWDAILEKAGKPKSGFVARAWIAADSFENRHDIYLVVSLQNVGQKPLTVAAIGGASTDVLIRGPRGKPAALTERGVGAFSQHGFFGSFRTTIIQPGDSKGTHVEIGEYYDLASDGDYTMLASVPWGYTSLGTYVVAKPVSLRLAPANGRPQPVVPVSRPGADGRKDLGNEPNDTEWRELRRQSGLRIRWCVLEQSVLPDDGRGPVLALSLTCAVHGGGEEPSLSRSQATAYKLLLRSPDGKATTINVKGPQETLPASQGFHQNEFMVPQEGDGIGALIALRDYIDFKQPGDYWLMATLPPQNAADPSWVAAPVKIHIDKK